ncbi:CHAT domain-containing protein [Sphaerotilus sp.]|uniref:CHAT domain-containing protein n=1 Tax=Sphaerotilus sp. TaxID=2093942 RepID=UPI002ACDAA05|nr:CHAT domain-containing protein [Sphaerotilus sp.]MDZ7859020.1 CHAT domain-containing protein [Sphaerotilus sp.]
MSDKNTPEAGSAVVLTLHGGKSLAPSLPACFTAARSRSSSTDSAEPHDPFLPPGFLIPRQTIALGRRTPQQRGTPAPTDTAPTLHVAPDELVVIELAHGGLVITRGERLHPQHLSEVLQAGGVSRGAVSDWAGEQIRRIYTVALGALPADDPVVEDLGDKVEDWLLDKVAAPLARKGVAGVVWAIERRLTGLCGLRRWHRDGMRNWSDEGVERGQKPMLVFLHDLASDTLGSFGALQGSETLGALERQFPGGVYGFEHRTLSCSPVVNATELVKALPQGAHVSLVTLGRGGLVGDLLCVTDFASTGHLPEAQRAELDRLAAVLRERKITVQRYLRVASPSDGTALLGESLDLFLSGVLSVVESGVGLVADPLTQTVCSAFQRTVLEMVRLRADASAIPGLADLLPDGPLGRFLRDASVQAGVQMAVIAGDTDDDDGWRRRMGLWLLDKVLIGSPYHDLVVDTPSMLGGIAAKVEPPVRVRLDAREEVSHFRYFQHPSHVQALKDWLCAPRAEALAALPGFDTLEAVQKKLRPAEPGEAPASAALTRHASSAVQSPRAARTRRAPRSTLRRKLEVSVHAADLRFRPGVLMVGHYEQDPIAGPQAVLDRELLQGLLAERHSLGLYPGPIGSALAVLPEGGGTQRGAVIVGLGRFEKPLTRDGLTEAVMAGVLRYLLQVGDCHGPAAQGLALNTLLIGTNSASSLSMGASVEALVRGVLEANARFHDTTRQDLRVDTLRIVELYLDTAITATYALNESGRQQTLRMAAAQLDTQLVSIPTLRHDEGARPRLFDGAAAGGNYWPRLMVTDARRSEDGAAQDDPPKPTTTSTQPTAVATRLRYLHLGQRARIETVEHQRQPGLVEQLVRQQIKDNRWNPDAGRALFQLMVPHALKDTLRHFQQLVVVVDAQTANMPWELVAADDPGRAGAAPRALALCIPLVRQLVTAEYRQQLRQSTGRAALVIGNPALDGFSEHFVNEKDDPLGQPPDLAGAADEAVAVAAVLQAHGHDVTLLADDDPPTRAADVLKALYRQPWRILHVCAHGGFALRTVDKVELTGVLLSDGAVITAAEIEAMEMVPELVFLNCCHLGQMSAPVRAGSVQRLAASLAQELIRVGVRCVVVAGWAVGDWPAQRFGEVFYDKLLGSEGLDFGHAVFEARKAAQDAAPQDITWGAYQAYGDPGWRANPQGSGGGPRPDHRFVTPDELLDKLAQLRVEATQLAKRHASTAADQRAQWVRIDALLTERCPEGHDWLTQPAVQAAVGSAWYGLSNFEEAIVLLKQAIQGEQKKGTVPIRAIELLSNALTRNAQVSADTGLLDKAEEQLQEALQWLVRLDQLAGLTTSERHSLRGSAHKRRADVLARRWAVAKASKVRRPRLMRTLGELREAVEAAIASYEASGTGPYPQLNALALQALICTDTEADGLIERARRCGAEAQTKANAQGAEIWDRLMPAEAELVAWLLMPDASAEAVAQARKTRATYSAVLEHHVLNPVERDSVLSQLDLLMRLAQAFTRPLAERLKVVHEWVVCGVKHGGAPCPR